MSSFEQFERQQIMAVRMKEQRDLDCVVCKKCGGEWFEEIHCQRYRNEHQVVIGQPVPARPGSVPYIMLRCVHCTNLIQPRVVHATRDIAGGDYDHFLDTLEGKMDTRKKEDQKVEVKDAVHTQEL